MTLLVYLSQAIFTQSIYLSITLWFSLGHFLHHFTHHGAILVILAIEILRFVPNSVAGVSDHGHSNLLPVCRLSVSVRIHCDLEASRESLVVAVISRVSLLQTGSHRVHVEEGVFAVVNICHGLSEQTLVTLITHCWQIQIRTTLLRLNSLESSNQFKTSKSVTLFQRRKKNKTLKKKEKKMKTYSASWNSEAMARSLAWAGSISFLSLLKLSLVKSCWFVDTNRSFAASSYPTAHSLLMAVPVSLAKLFP